MGTKHEKKKTMPMLKQSTAVHMKKRKKTSSKMARMSPKGTKVKTTTTKHFFW